MKLLRKVTTIFDRIINVLAVLAGIILIYIMLSVCTEVLVRYLGHQTRWVIEIATYGLLFMTFLVAAWLLRKEGHVRMELVLSRFSPRTQTIINTITSILGTVTCFIITWYSVLSTWEHFQKGWLMSTLLEPPAYPILAIIPVGSFFLSIQFIRRTYGYLKEWRAPTKERIEGAGVSIV